MKGCYTMFHLKHDDTLHILLYQNLMSKGTDEVKEIKWSEWCEFLTRPVIHSSDKYANKLAIYGDISEGVDEKTGEVLHHRRKNEYVMYRQVFSLDYDDIDDMKRFIKAIQEKLNRFSYFMYSTYRHRDVQDPQDSNLAPRFRLLVPVDDILEPQEYTTYAGALARYIGEPIDESCFKPVQLSALPVIKDKNKPYHWFINDAPFITRDQLDSCLQMYPASEPVEQSQPIVLRHNKRDSEHWKDICMGVSSGERNVALTQVIGHLLSKRVDPNLVYGLAYGWSKQCEPAISDKEINQTFKSIYLRHTRKE
ncbi:mobile element-associated protein [Staphylococcus microti]|nr:mobile element-associated protein [Staphylococcus microti]